MAQQTNPHYGALAADNSITYAPLSLRERTTTYGNPTRERYAAHGWLPIVDEPPTQEGYSARPVMWTEEGGRIVRLYELVPLPPVVHTYKRSFLAQWLRGAGYWAAFKALLVASDDLGFFWETSTEFDSDHPAWPTALAGIKAALQLTDEQVAAMLACGETGGAQ